MPEYFPPPPDYITTHEDVLRQPWSRYCSAPGGVLLLLHGWCVIKLVWARFITAPIGD